MTPEHPNPSGNESRPSWSAVVTGDAAADRSSPHHAQTRHVPIRLQAGRLLESKRNSAELSRPARRQLRTRHHRGRTVTGLRPPRVERYVAGSLVRC
jgi:hypothetical protein